MGEVKEGTDGNRENGRRQRKTELKRMGNTDKGRRGIQKGIVMW